jgi:F0F1-type ATP synthase delta subunit
MPEFITILRTVSPEKFVEILATCSRQARETYFHRHSVRAPAEIKTRLPKPVAKNEARARVLYEILQETEDGELAEEVLRTYLLNQRPLLCAALDHLGIAHNNGLTEGDVTKFEKLSGRETRQLVAVLKNIAADDVIALYLKFMGAKNVDEAF